MFTVFDIFPTGPVQFKVYVFEEFNGPVFSIPEVFFTPAQSPDAVHEVIFEDDHVRFAELPIIM
jgi:hypothetical protein